MDPIEINVNFDPRGKITPLNFAWKGRTYTIESVGRRWQGADGTHILVMAIGNRAFHLIFNSENFAWRLLRGGDVPTIPAV